MQKTVITGLDILWYVVRDLRAHRRAMSTAFAVILTTAVVISRPARGQILQVNHHCNLYGTTASGAGTVFRLNTNNVPSSFTLTSGQRG